MEKTLDGWTRHQIAVGREIARRNGLTQTFTSLGVVTEIERQDLGKPFGSPRMIAITDKGQRITYAGRVNGGGCAKSNLWSREAK